MAPPPHLFQGYRWCFAIMVYIYVLSLSSIASKNITITIGVMDTTTTLIELNYQGIEQFDTLKKKLYSKYETGFETNHWKGVYYNVTVAPADWYGGAEGKGFYALTTTNQPYKLKITETEHTKGHGLNFFGLWASSMKKVDRLDFFYKKKPIFNISLGLIYDKIRKGGIFDRYWRNRYFTGTETEQAFVFISFYFGAAYDEVHFSSSIGSFCSDNHSVGIWNNIISGITVYTGKLLTDEPISPPAIPSTPETKTEAPKAEPPRAKPPRAKPPRAKPTAPKAQPSAPRAEPTAPKAQSSAPRAEPTAPEAQPSAPRTEPTAPEAQPSATKGQPSTPAQKDLIPTISTAWITVGVILGIVALV